MKIDLPTIPIKIFKYATRSQHYQAKGGYVDESPLPRVDRIGPLESFASSPSPTTPNSAYEPKRPDFRLNRLPPINRAIVPIISIRKIIK